MSRQSFPRTKSSISAASLCLMVIFLTCCQAKGNTKVTTKTTTPQEFDQLFQQALQGMAELQKQRLVHAQPCIIIGGERDYRYRYCFAERAGSAVSTMRQVHDLFLKAGFEGEVDSEGLNAVFSLPGAPYSIQSIFGVRGIEWVVYEEGRGFVAPDPKRDGPDAPYALLSPQEFVRIQAIQYAMFSSPRDKPMPKSVPCGVSNTTEASICFTQPIKNPLQPFIDIYFGGEKKTFDILNKKNTFQHDESELIAEMIKEGSLKEGAKPSTFFTKVKPNVYQLTDTFDHPAYRLTFDLTAPGGTGIKITAKRIPISPEVKARRESP